MEQKAYNSLKSKCSTSKGLVTKALNKLDTVLKSWEKSGDDIPATSKKRKAREVMEWVSKAKERLEAYQGVKDSFVELVQGMEENSIKDTTPAQVAANAEASFDKMEDKLDKIMTENDAFIIRAEKALEEDDKVMQVPDKKAEETEGVLDWKKNNYFKP